MQRPTQVPPPGGAAIIAAGAAAAAVATEQHHDVPVSSNELATPEEYVAAFDYAGDQESDISFSVGDTVLVRSQVRIGPGRVLFLCGAG